MAARARTIGHVAGTTNRNRSEGRFPELAIRADELGRCPAEWCSAPTVPRMFRIMVGAADVLGLKSITLEVALRDAAARQLGA